MILDFIKEFAQELFQLLNAMSPYLLLGFFFAGVLKVWFPQHWIDRYMGKSNFKSVVNTALIGIPLPLCSCGVIPTGISFYKNGASKGSSVSFLISTPQTGVDSILVTYSLLGLPFAIIRVLVALITGVIGGVVTNILAKDKKEPIETCTDSCCSNDNTVQDRSLQRVLKYGFNEFLMDIAKWLIIGILIAAVLSTIIPDEFFTLYLQNEALSMFTVLIASVPLYLCATASVPIAAVLMMKGLSPGAALILLMAGPATNAATITIIKKVFGNKTLFSYLGSIIGGALVFGFLINHFLPAEWFQMTDASHLHHQHELLPPWMKIASTVVLIGLIIYGYLSKNIEIRKTQLKPETKTNNDSIIAPSSSINVAPNFNASQFSFAGNLTTKTFQVEGMTCSHCKASVEKNLKKIDGINIVIASPSINTVEITGKEIDESQVEKAINELGYDVKGILK
ncbi:SO_0444 family Cu/Zn efflux transporter [Labilibacter marinus]|uniref:SO_0444 family Cu/Zn efflux transporter n=1 Tax=Labilibacter marinus TaxID=1477105 RepID=UPI00094FA752|nr:SO_0444 family Cu/Zn efflux transporter [Labilibacter marinus]